jgi:preprotein translocase subunit SecD/SecD/SecF fusion protein
MATQDQSPKSAAASWAEATGQKPPSSNKKKGSKPRRHLPAEVRRWTGTLIALAVVLVVCVIGFTPLGEKITQGLDIQGGVSVIMTASKPDGTAVTDTDMDSAVTIVTNRVNSLGASEATVQRQGTDQILIQIPGATDAQQAIDTIGTTGTLEFVDLYDISDQDALALIEAGVSNVQLEPGTYTAFMTGDQIKSVSIGQESQTSAYYAVNLKLDATGTQEFADVTTVLAPTNGKIAILLDGVVQSAPAVQSAITGGEVAITGNYTLEDAQAFKTVLESGALPVTLEYSESRFVGPTLGQDSLAQGLVAIVAGFVLIFIYLLVFYRGMGLVCDAALIVFGIVYLGVLAFLSALGQFALSLPGLAGIVLTIGMAADSSILVLERFREELRAGRSVRASAAEGTKHGVSCALDAGVVSLISALGLFFLTTGSVRGFGLTLALGVLCSFFTLLCFTSPAVRLLARSAIAKNPGFWGVKDDIAEGSPAPVSAVKGGGVRA